jgi:hypothetical protein
MQYSQCYQRVRRKAAQANLDYTTAYALEYPLLLQLLFYGLSGYYNFSLSNYINEMDYPGKTKD